MDGGEKGKGGKAYFGPRLGIDLPHGLGSHLGRPAVVGLLLDCTERRARLVESDGRCRVSWRLLPICANRSRQAEKSAIGGSCRWFSRFHKTVAQVGGFWSAQGLGCWLRMEIQGEVYRDRTSGSGSGLRLGGANRQGLDVAAPCLKPLQEPLPPPVCPLTNKTTQASHQQLQNQEAWVTQSARRDQNFSHSPPPTPAKPSVHA
jgi:hypothetical protein